MPSIGPFAVQLSLDGHGERLPAGGLPPGDRGAEVGGEPGQTGDLVLMACHSAAEGVLVAVVGAFGADEPGEGRVGFGFVHQQRIVRGQRLGLAERQHRVADVADLPGVHGR